jgi:hypothetical protein
MHTIAASGPLRLRPDDAADSCSALANADLYLPLTDQFGWTAEQFRTWLVETTLRLLLEDHEQQPAP